MRSKYLFCYKKAYLTFYIHLSLIYFFIHLKHECRMLNRLSDDRIICSGGNLVFAFVISGNNVPVNWIPKRRVPPGTASTTSIVSIILVGCT